MEVVDGVAGLFAQESQQSVIVMSEILGLTRGKVVWMQQGYVSPVMLPTPTQMMRLLTGVDDVSADFWLFRPAPGP
jgi:hypothetical protein